MCDNMSLWTAVLVAFGDNMSANVRFYLVLGFLFGLSCTV